MGARLARGRVAPTIVTERDSATGAIFACNPWNMSHGTQIAFADLAARQTAWTPIAANSSGAIARSTIRRR